MYLKRNNQLYIIFISNIFFSLHFYLIYFLNSTFLSTFFSDSQLSTLYILGSILDIFLLINAPHILNKLGNYKFIISVIVIEFLATIGLVVTTNHFAIGFYFILHLICISLILFNLDIFIESALSDEDDTGSVRAIFLTITSICEVLSPTILALLLFRNSFTIVYLVSAFFLIPLFFIIRKFKKMPTTVIPGIRIRETILIYIRNKDIYNIFNIQFQLQLFYAFMGIYMPLYLQKYIGFSWTEIGLIFTIMLLPFVFIEVPVGRLADQKYGEKEFLTIGFVIMTIATICISFITAKSFIIWASILFITRIGASIVEISSDTYFFKQVDQSKTNIISLYRIARPLSFIVAPILATLSLQFIPFQFVFILIGFCMILGAHYSLALHDTK